MNDMRNIYQVVLTYMWKIPVNSSCVQLSNGWCMVNTCKYINHQEKLVSSFEYLFMFPLCYTVQVTTSSTQHSVIQCTRICTFGAHVYMSAHVCNLIVFMCELNMPVHVQWSAPMCIILQNGSLCRYLGLCKIGHLKAKYQVLFRIRSVIFNNCLCYVTHQNLFTAAELNELSSAVYRNRISTQKDISENTTVAILRSHDAGPVTNLMSSVGVCYNDNRQIPTCSMYTNIMIHVCIVCPCVWLCFLVLLIHMFHTCHIVFNLYCNTSALCYNTWFGTCPVSLVPFPYWVLIYN